MIKIHFMSIWGRDHNGILDWCKRQTPNNDGVWENIVACESMQESDYYIVIQGFPKNLNINKIDMSKVIYFQGEPSVKQLPISPDLPVAYYGIYRRQYETAKWPIISKTFKELVELPVPKIKSTNLVTVMSTKHKTHCQKQRLAFMQKLRKEYPVLAVYGWGRKPELGKCKFNVMYGKQYYLGMEPDIALNYFTTHITDSFLMWMKPIYWGCPNISDYFPSESYSAINITDPNCVSQVIEELEKPINYEAIREARDLVLHKYNMWAVIQKVIENIS